MPENLQVARESRVSLTDLLGDLSLIVHRMLDGGGKESDLIEMQRILSVAQPLAAVKKMRIVALGDMLVERDDQIKALGRMTAPCECGFRDVVCAECGALRWSPNTDVGGQKQEADQVRAESHGSSH